MSEAKMTMSQECFERSKKVSPGGVHSPVRSFKSVGLDPIFFKSAEGAYIESVDGDKYIDFCQSFGPNILGHRHPEVSKVVEEIFHQAWSLGACEPYSLHLAEKMTELVPALDKVRFVNSGTEAVMTALRVARAATDRKKILKFEGCYHGHVDSMLVKAGSGLADAASSDSAGVSAELANNTVVIPLDDEGAIDEAFRKNEFAAVIIEPLPANFGLLKQRKECWEHLARKAKEQQALVIFDEVISGFRVGLAGMAGELNIQPDLITYGKIIGGGFPVGAYGGRGDLMDMIAPTGPVYQAGTLAANPIGMVAGHKTLTLLEEENVHETLKQRTDGFVEEMNKLFEKSQSPLGVVSQGSLFWIHTKVGQPIRSTKDFSPDSGRNFTKFFRSCIQRGLFLAPSAFEVGFVSLAHTDEILKKSLRIMEEALQE